MAIAPYFCPETITGTFTGRPPDRPRRRETFCDPVGIVNVDFVALVVVRRARR